MATKTPKSILNELLMINLCSQKPEFITELIGGQPHLPVFRCTLTVPAFYVGGRQTEAVKAEGLGSSKREAEHTATMEALKRLKDVEGLRWPEMTLAPHKHHMHSFTAEESELAAELGGTAAQQ